MQTLTPEGTTLVNDIAYRYQLSHDAVLHMLIAVNNGGGTMAQFNCPELGGSGQWMSGGMTMVGDMFNHGLKMTVDNLCAELSSAMANTQVFPVIPAGTPGSNQWWPSEYGSPFSSGSQNNIRYAVFPGKLAVELNGQVTVYDTLNHNIGGVSQQQGGDTSLTFSSQFGTISVNQLPVISNPTTSTPNIPTPNASSTNNYADDNTSAANDNFAVANEVVVEPTYENDQSQQDLTSTSTSTDEIIRLIESLAKLRDSGALTEQDFTDKKAELLARI